MEGLGFKSGFDEADQEALANAAHENKRTRANRGGLGFGGDDSQQGDGAAIQKGAADHYNARGQSKRRLDSKIDTLQQKNFNNWIKATLIASAVKPAYSILDLACGKGGDLPKWSKQQIGHYVGVDIAYKSIQDAIERYNGQDGDGRARPCFPAVFCAGNFCDVDFFAPLERALPGVRFDAVSCQFAIHYSWTSEAEARNALRNAARRLKPGGLFVGTTTDTNVLIKKLQAAPGLKFGNSLYSVEFLPDKGKEHEPFDKNFRGRSPFNLRYRFYLKDAVDDCEECLVHFPTFRRLGEEVGLELVEHINFHDYFERCTTMSSRRKESIELAKRMRVFDNRSTITPDQWEVTYLYKTFVFRKVKDSERSRTEGNDTWLKAKPEHRRCDPKDIVVLTKDCTPEAQGVPRSS